HHPGDVLGPAVEVEGDDVLQRLEGGQQVAAVADLDVAGHRPHPGIGEVVASMKPWFRAAALPRFSWRTSRNPIGPARPPAVRWSRAARTATSAVPSVDPSSTTISSAGAGSRRATAAMALAITSASL